MLRKMANRTPEDVANIRKLACKAALHARAPDLEGWEHSDPGNSFRTNQPIVSSSQRYARPLTPKFCAARRRWKPP